MAKVKYIAAGFAQDAEKVLTEFVEERSPDFSVFTHIWKKHNFAAIYLGRSKRELEQFTQEIFQLTLNFLETADLFHQIGSVYLLYALFRNQIIEPPVRIRITLEQHEHFLNLKKLAVKERYITLHYVISFLMERNGFDYVAHATLLGPRNSKHNLEMESRTIEMNNMLQEIKNNQKSIFDNNLLKEVEDLSTEYAELIKDKPFVNKELIPDLDLRTYMNHLRRLHKLISGDKNDSSSNSQSDKEQEDNIGSRRAQLKSKAFESKALFRQLNPTDEDEEEYNEGATSSRAERESFSRRVILPQKSAAQEHDEESEENGTKSRRKRRGRNFRVRKGNRQIGRPKNVDKELEKVLMDIEEAPEGNLKRMKKRGPPARSSYLDDYIEEAFKAPIDEMTSLSFSSFFDDNDKDIDEPDFCTDEAGTSENA